jgi:hypothetical protein
LFKEINFKGKLPQARNTYHVREVDFFVIRVDEKQKKYSLEEFFSEFSDYGDQNQWSRVNTQKN